MTKRALLHMLTPTPNVSPFDVNMAYDAGFDAVIPYLNVGPGDVANLTQDAIFSRGPSGVKRTGIFVGGREVGLAADMLDAARKAMVPPFEVSVFADPSGAFTTAAAMVAAVERQLKKAHGADLAGRTVLVLGGTGPVGTAAAALAASAGAKVQIASSSGIDKARATADVIKNRYGADAEPTTVADPAEKVKLVAGADVVLAAAKAGVQVLSEAELAGAQKLLVAADVNAVPPAGVAGIDLKDDGVKIGAGQAVGIGALAIGDIKYRVQQQLFRMMLETDRPRYLGLTDAFDAARAYAR